MSHFPNENDPGFVNPGNIPLAHTVQKLSSSPASSSILLDNFARPDGHIGTSDSGWPWGTFYDFNGSSTFTPFIIKNIWGSGSTESTCGIFNSPINVPSLGATISFITAGGGADWSVFRFGLAQQSGSNFIKDFLMLEVARTNYVFWYQTSLGGYINFSNSNLPIPLLKDGTRYMVSLILKDANFIVDIGQNQFIIPYPSLISKIFYRNAFFGMYCYNPSTSDLSRIHSLWTSDITR